MMVLYSFPSRLSIMDPYSTSGFKYVSFDIFQTKPSEVPDDSTLSLLLEPIKSTSAGSPSVFEPAAPSPLQPTNSATTPKTARNLAQVILVSSRDFFNRQNRKSREFLRGKFSNSLIPRSESKTSDLIAQSDGVATSYRSTTSVQPNGSGASPNWIAVYFVKSSVQTGPGFLPSP